MNCKKTYLLQTRLVWIRSFQNHPIAFPRLLMFTQRYAPTFHAPSHRQGNIISVLQTLYISCFLSIHYCSPFLLKNLPSPPLTLINLWNCFSQRSFVLCVHWITNFIKKYKTPRAGCAPAAPGGGQGVPHCCCSFEALGCRVLLSPSP